MKEIYWRPKEISKTILIILSVFSLAGLMVVEFFLSRKEQPYYKKKIVAANYASKAMNAVKQEKKRRNMKINREDDPANSGMIGYFMTPVTSKTGVLEAKQTSINPNFAAVILEQLKKADVKEGDIVAVGFSGSFPALNISVLAAAKALNLKLLILTSASASQYGANDPDFVWLDIEKLLFDKKIFPYRTSYATLGGKDDAGKGMPDLGIGLLKQAVLRNGIPIMENFPGMKEKVERNMRIFEELSMGEKIKAYINVGGGTVSTGSEAGKKLFQPGLNLSLNNRRSKGIDSVMKRFIQKDVPVIHLTQIKVLAAKYGLPISPKETPRIGEGKIYYKEEYNTYLALSIFLGIILLLYIFFKTELGVYIFYNTKYNTSKKSDLEPTI